MVSIDLRMRSCFGRPRMAVAFTKPWDASVEKNVRDFYHTLSEKDRRRFAAVQARQLGYGSVRYIAEVVGCSRRTIERGLVELDALPHDPRCRTGAAPRCRSKKKVLPHSPLEQNLKSVLETRTAGDPDDVT